MAELKPRNTTKTPPQTKEVHREFNFPFFPLRIWLPNVMCFAIQDGTECAKMPSLSVSHIPSCGKGQQDCWAMGKSTPGYLAGSQTVLSILQNTTELPGAARAGEQSKSTKLGEPECDRSKGPGPCAFEWVTRLGPRRGKGKRALLGRGAG